MKVSPKMNEKQTLKIMFSLIQRLPWRDVRDSYKIKLLSKKRIQKLKLQFF